MARLILGVTGSVAAVKAPALAWALREAGHEVRVVATQSAIYFVRPDAFDRDGVGLLRDEDEWPESGYERGDPVGHIELRRWADALVVAPLDANTLAKFALGLSDNYLTCVFRAWDFTRPVFLAPAMNTLMWESPVTLRHLRQMLEDHGEPPIPAGWRLDEASTILAQYAPRIVLIPPQSKRLACGDVGAGAMAEVDRIAAIVGEWFDRAGATADSREGAVPDGSTIREDKAE